MAGEVGFLGGRLLIVTQLVVTLQVTANLGSKLIDVHNRPKRYDVGQRANVQWGSTEEYFRVQYLEFLDTAMIQLRRRYEQPGIQTYITNWRI